MMLPKRKTRERTKPVERRIWERHRRFVRSHECAILDRFTDWSDACAGRAEFAHLRLGTHTGMKQKPHDALGICLCAKHHKEAHDHGEATFQAKYKLDWAALAGEFARKSPDVKMREAMKEAA